MKEREAHWAAEELGRHVRPEDPERSAMGRREALLNIGRGIAGGIGFLLARGVQGGEEEVVSAPRKKGKGKGKTVRSEADMQEKEDDAPRSEAEEAVRELGFLTINHDPRNNPWERVIRGPCVVPPAGMRLLNVIISSELNARGSRVSAVLPVARDAFFQRGVVVAADAWVNGQRAPLEECRVIYSNSRPPPAGVPHYLNPVLRMQVRGSGRITVRVKCVVLQAVYAENNRQEELFRRTLLNSSIGPGFVSACRKKYDNRVVGSNPMVAAMSRRGDCGVKAAEATRLGQGFVQTMEGYSFRQPDADRDTSGRHFINGVRWGNSGWLTADPRAEDDFYVGPPRNFILVGMGNWNIVPGSADFNPTSGLFGGAYGSDGPFTVDGTQLSVAGFGPYRMEAARGVVPPAVEQYAKELEMDMKRWWEQPPTLASRGRGKTAE